MADVAPNLIAAIRRAARQEQFLEVVSAEEASARFNRHIDLSPLPEEKVALSAALGRVLAQDLAAVHTGDRDLCGADEEEVVVREAVGLLAATWELCGRAATLWGGLGSFRASKSGRPVVTFHNDR